MAGRITLAKSVMSNIPLYPMQVARIPMSICKEVERMQRNFIWGHTDGHGHHNLGWNQVVLPEHYGGLGCKKLTSMNRAFGCKLAWNLVVGTNSLWAEVLFRKYMLRNEQDLLTSKTGDSQLWHLICHQKEIIAEGIKWQVRDGMLVSFFHDNWISNGMKLEDYSLKPLSEEENSSLVSEWVDKGIWDLNRLGTVISSDIIKRLIALLPTGPEVGKDIMVWGANSNGLFSVKAAYYLIEKPIAHLHDSAYRLIWKWRGAERIRVFLRLVFHNRLHTYEWRSKWSSTAALCPSCDLHVESTFHILRDCQYATNVWRALIQPKFYSSFFAANMRDWERMNLKKEMRSRIKDGWDLLWGVGVWKLWNWRNKWVFEDQVKPTDPALVLLSSWHLFVQKPEVTDLYVTTPPAMSTWTTPPNGWMKVNVDGAATAKANRASCGGIIRDSKGTWIAGFCYYLGTCGAQDDEEWGLLKGMQLAWDMGFKKEIVEVDSKNLVHMLLSNINADKKSTVFLQAKNMLMFHWEVKIINISRTQNSVADQLAKDGSSRSMFY